MIGIDIREYNALKIIQPVVEGLIKRNIPYIIFHYDTHRGSKEYNRASCKNIGLSAKHILDKAKLIRPYTNNEALFKMLISHKVKKFIGLELSLCYKKMAHKLEKSGIKLYSLLYLTDSLWNSTKESYSIYRTYFGAKCLMETALSFSGTQYDSNKHKVLGSPLFDQLKGLGSGNNTLVLLPNVAPADASRAFGSSSKFIKIMEKIAEGNSLIFKTRKKQWLPEEIKKFAKEIVYDGTNMYPSSFCNALNKCDSIVMFFSSGIYESVVSGKYVTNITIPLNRWSWNQTKMQKYFSVDEGSLYQYAGVVDTIDQDNIENLVVKKNVDQDSRKEWLDKFIGNNNFNSSDSIVDDILRS